MKNKYLFNKAIDELMALYFNWNSIPNILNF